MAPFVIYELLGLFVNALSADDKHFMTITRVLRFIPWTLLLEQNSNFKKVKFQEYWFPPSV